MPNAPDHRPDLAAAMLIPPRVRTFLHVVVYVSVAVWSFPLLPSHVLVCSLAVLLVPFPADR
jgi:hypothetical protein